jgi:hypothetical protein
MPWYKIMLTERAVGLGALEKAHDAFAKKMLEYIGHSEMAVFDCKNEERSNTILYISPKMALVSPRELAEFSAQETPPPFGNEPEFDVLVSANESAALALIRN